MATAVVIGWLLFPGSRSNNAEEANTLLAVAMELLRQSASESDPDSRSLLLEDARRNLDRIIEELPNTYLGDRIAADDPMRWLKGYEQFLASGDACVRAITQDCVLELAVQVAKELLVQEDGFEPATRALYGSLFTDVRRHPVLARAFSTELLEFVSEQEIWFQSQSWLTAIASLQSLFGELDDTIVTVNTLDNVAQRDAVLGFLVSDIALSARGDALFEDVSSRPIALDLVRSAQDLAGLIETLSSQDDAFLRVFSAQVRASDISGARDTISRMSLGSDRDRALRGLSLHYAQSGDVNAAVETSNEIENERTRSRTIMLVAEETGPVGPDRGRGLLISTLSELSRWVEGAPDDEFRSQIDRPYIVANVSQAYAALGDFEAAIGTAVRIENDNDLRATTIADIVGSALRADRDVSFALSVADASSSATDIALIFEEVAWDLVRRGNLVSARAMMEDAEAASPTTERENQTLVARIPVARTWVALGDIDRALTLAESRRRDGFVRAVIQDLLSEGAVRSARNLLVTAVELGIFAENESNWNLVQSVRDLGNAQLDMADEDGALETLTIGREALFWSGSEHPSAYELLELVGVFARIGDRSGAREMLALATDRLLHQDSATYQLELLLEIAILMNALSQ